MSVTAPPLPPTLPTPPTTASPTDFDVKADAFNAALPGFQTGMEALANNAYANALDGESSASAAAQSKIDAAAAAVTAVGAAGAPVWVSGTTYAYGAPAISTLDAMLYRRFIAGAGTTDPKNDPVNWRPTNTVSPAASSIFLATNFGGM